MKLSRTISNSFIFLGGYYLIRNIWRELEILIYDFSQESLVDGIICAILSCFLTCMLSVWQAMEDTKK